MGGVRTCGGQERRAVYLVRIEMKRRARRRRGRGLREWVRRCRGWMLMRTSRWVHSTVPVAPERAMAVGHRQSHIYNVTGCIGCPQRGSLAANNTWPQDSSRCSIRQQRAPLDAFGQNMYVPIWNMRCCGALLVQATPTVLAWPRLGRACCDTTFAAPATSRWAASSYDCRSVNAGANGIDSLCEQ
jgi:hypothetical protein